MGAKERRERERAQRREQILAAASEIVSQEGADRLSIRKIADRIEYSPALIYHYFNNKEEIAEVLMERGFKRIVSGLQSAVFTTGQPEQQFRQFMRAYIENALANGEEYKAVLLSGSPGLLKYTALLYEGASHKPSVGMIQRFFQDSYFKGVTDDLFVERTVQVIWTSMFGLIIKLLLEDVSDEQRQRLIDHQIEMMFGAVTWLSQKTVGGQDK